MRLLRATTIVKILMLTSEYADGDVIEWRLTAESAERMVQDDYRPTLYVGDAVGDLYGRHGGPTPSPPARDGLSDALADVRSFLAGQQAVERLGVERHRQTFRTPARPVLRVDASGNDEIRRIAKRVQQYGEPDTYTCYNVDLTRQFRYCLETDTPAGPDRSVRSLRTLSLELPSHRVDTDGLTELTVDGEQAGTTPDAVVKTVAEVVNERDPDVLIVSTSEVVPLLFEAAETAGVDLRLVGVTATRN